MCKACKNYRNRKEDNIRKWWAHKRNIMCIGVSVKEVPTLIIKSQERLLITEPIKYCPNCGQELK